MAKLNSNFPEVKRRIEAALDAGLQTAAGAYQQSVQSIFPTGALSGAAIGQRVDTQAASPPGTPPYAKSNRLKSSIDVARRGRLRWVVGTNLKYARIHELGGTVRRRPQPYIVMPDETGRVRAIWISRATAARRRAKGLPVRMTSGSATYPARPYMRPVLVRDRDKLTAFVAAAARREFARGTVVSGVIR